MTSTSIRKPIPAISPETEITEVDGVQWVYYDGEPVTVLGRSKALENIYVHVEPGYTVGRCKMIKRDGDRCRNAVRPGWPVCKYHGAGTPSSPGGRPPVNGRYSQHLPTRFLEQYKQFLNDPDNLSLAHEMALIDTRVGELLTMLDGADTKQAWVKIRSAWHRIRNKAEETGDDDLTQAAEMLREALTIRTNDHDLWEQIQGSIEQRRKLSDTERRRIVDAKNFMTLQEANAMMAYVVNLVMENVTDPLTRQRISEGIRRFAHKDDAVVTGDMEELDDNPDF